MVKETKIKWTIKHWNKLTSSITLKRPYYVRNAIRTWHLLRSTGIRRVSKLLIEYFSHGSEKSIRRWFLPLSIPIALFHLVIYLLNPMHPVRGLVTNLNYCIISILIYYSYFWWAQVYNLWSLHVKFELLCSLDSNQRFILQAVVILSK